MRMWRAASRVGWRRREEICGVRGFEVGVEGGRRGGGFVRRWVWSFEKVGGVVVGCMVFGGWKIDGCGGGGGGGAGGGEENLGALGVFD